jgi:hypothetical protein
MRRPIPLCFALLFSALAAPATAGTISFDEVPPGNNNRATLSEEYAHMGVHFITTDDGVIWSGISDGDPGGWALEGTNGSAFVGFNGLSYEMSALLDEVVGRFRLDVTRGDGSELPTFFTLVGYQGGSWVDEVFVDLGTVAVNEWVTVELIEPIDEVHMYGEGDQPFAIDNLQWGGDAPGPDLIPIEIAVRSGRSNRINPFSEGVVPVALFGSEHFDVREVVAESLAFGPEGAPVFHETHPHVADLNGDGWDDLLCHHAVPMTGIAFGDTEVCLTGEMANGAPFEGCTEIRTTPQLDEDKIAKQLTKKERQGQEPRRGDPR